MPEHPQVRVEHDGFAAGVDEELADLILDLWRLDLGTSNSCQDNLGKVWIEFTDGASAEVFLSIVAGTHEVGVESLYNRVVGFYVPPAEGETQESWDEFWEQRAWDYRVNAHDLSLRDEFDATAGEWNYEWLGPADVALSVSVRFAPSDLPEVERRVRAFAVRLQSGPPSDPTREA